RALITATRPTDLLLTDIRATHSRATDTQVTRDIQAIPDLRATAIPAIQDSPLTPVPRPADRRSTRDTPLTPVLLGMDTQAIRDSPLTPSPRPMATRADRRTLPIPLPVMDIPWRAILASGLRRTGLLGPSTQSSLLVEVAA
ncbi:MAG TPA: hypothetical protein VHY59_12500, partial [Chthoniobacterales bacterium]|nr:hypothetical protein [Chthoniobacterales bacterium]